MTSPPAIVPRARQTGPAIEDLMNRTLPSARSGVDAAGVIAPRGDGREGRARTPPVNSGVPWRSRSPSPILPEDLLVRRPGRGHPGLLGIAVDPRRVSLPDGAAAAAVLRSDRERIGRRDRERCWDR